jgi:glutaredoxin
MKSKAVFYHAGCPVCIDAEKNLAFSIDPQRFDLEVVHLGDAKARVAEADRLGVKSVPALVIDGDVYHINFGAALDDLR